MDQKRVAVLVATYNGEKYVEEQLKSILNQEYPSDLTVDVYVHDDGSQDATLKIIDTLTRSFKNVHIMRTDMAHIGVKRSLYLLMSRIDADYYFFSDQDDIWEQHKIESVISSFETDDSLAVYSDLLLVDEKNQSLGKTMSDANRWSDDERRDFAFLCLNPRVTGAALAINQALRDTIITHFTFNQFDQVTMHDSFIALLASVEDRLEYINIPLVRYRQHGHNQIGATQSFKQRCQVLRRIQNVKKRFIDISIFFDHYNQQITNGTHLREAQILYTYAKSGLLSRLTSLLLNFRFWSRVSIEKALIEAMFENNDD